MNAYDVIVAGAGMAGLTAALTAAAAGARVLVIEKGDAPGGSARLSGGLVWTEPSYDDLRERNPRGDPELGRALVSGYEDGIAWLRSLGARMTERLDGLFGRGVGHRLGPNMPAFIDLMVDRLVRAGATLVRGTELRDVRLDERGAVAGVRALGPKGFREFDAPAVVLATGGFPAGTELLARWVGPNADRLVLRANPWSTGDGILAGLAAGAATSRGLHAFYGHLVPAPPTRVTPDKFIALTQYYSVQSLLVNICGERFVDETEADEINAQALCREPQALGFLILDATLDDAVTAPPAAGFPRVDRHGEIVAAGGQVLRAPSMLELARVIDGAGGNGARTVATIEEYNAAIAESPARLRVGRRRHRRPIAVPPFTAVPVVPAITMTEGGLRIDATSRVLSRAQRPIPGLYAAGADAGGVFYERYAGGLANALVFGRRAGAEAATFAVGGCAR